MPFLWQREQGFGKKLDVGGMHRQFIGLGAKQKPFHSNEVTDVQQPVKLKILLSHRVLPRINLQTMISIRDVRKPGLAVAAQCHESSTNPDLDLFGFQLFARIALVAIRNLAERVSEIVTMRVSGIT